MKLKKQLIWVCFLLFQGSALFANRGEFRALWTDAYHPGFFTRIEVTQLIFDVRAANCNVVIPEVRKRGDAYYNSKFEPKARNITEDYDPLADLIEQAHDTKLGPKVEVHAWMIVYPVWSIGGRPYQTNHPYVLHPEWLNQSSGGQTYDGKDYAFDPGHPEVQQYLYNIAMDIVKNYDVDGLNLDYIHYPGKNWGYNPESVARFNRLFNRTGKPSVDDPAWMQFRRDQVTALVRKIYLSALDLKPHVKISTASITWPPAPKDQNEWIMRSAAYNNVFQDWRRWMEEGIIDINIPMIYGPNHGRGYAETYSDWCVFAKQHRYGRHVVISPALYLNSLEGSFAQIRDALTTGGSKPDGIALYSYANFSKDSLPREKLVHALTRSSPGRENEPAVFARPVPTPEMPWKTKPSKGYLKGFVYGGKPKNAVDGATIQISGPTNRTMTSDATGFYGAVDLPPGEYSIRATFADQKATTKTRIVVGKVKSTDIILKN